MDDGLNTMESEAAIKGSVIGGDATPGECRLETITEPCAIIIIGASGDLTSRKIVPALFRLYETGCSKV